MARVVLVLAILTGMMHFVLVPVAAAQAVEADWQRDHDPASWMSPPASAQAQPTAVQTNTSTLTSLGTNAPLFSTSRGIVDPPFNTPPQPEQPAVQAPEPRFPEAPIFGRQTPMVACPTTREGLHLTLGGINDDWKEPVTGSHIYEYNSAAAPASALRFFYRPGWVFVGFFREANGQTRLETVSQPGQEFTGWHAVALCNPPGFAGISH